MDRPLDSSRERDSRDHPYGGGGGGGYHGGSGYRGRGRGGGGRGRGRFGRGRGGGRGRGRGGGRGYHGNRGNNYESEDPNARLTRQLSVMVSRVGDLKSLSTDASTTDNDDPTNADNNNNIMRPVVMAEAKNISDLTQVVCKATNVATFLKFVPPPPPPPPPPADGEATSSVPSFVRPPPKPEDQAGPLAHLIVSCAATLPLQTPCYAALTLSVHEYSKSNAQYAGFANRCVTYAMQRLVADMDALFLSSTSVLERPKVACRVKLVLRYLAFLGKLEIIPGQDNEEVVSDDHSYSLLGLLQRFVQAAVAGTPNDGVDAFAPTSSASSAAPLMLVYFVLSTIPYVLSFIPADVIQDKLLDPLQAILGSYASTFTPGTGMTAILLKEEQMEGDEEEDDDDDDDDEDEEEASEQVCDSLQDLHRSVKLMMQQDPQPETPSSRFALLSDAPWKGIPAPPAEDAASMDTSAEPVAEQGATPTGPLAYSGSSIRLEVPEGDIQALNVMLNSSGNNDVDDEGNAQDSPKIQAFHLEAVVFGRLPFFGAPQTGDDVDQDGEDMEDEDGPANEQVGAYIKEFGILDRCFLADVIRDLLLCHESAISAIGQERGSAKTVAEQLWSVSQVFTNTESDGSPKGMEYGIIEALLGLIVQSSSSSTFRQIYLSRVLLELTRLKPTLLSPALAIALSNLFQDYLPSLVPAARHNLSCWFAFHLINTDYQWPAAYWTHWQTYFGGDKRPTSRRLFVETTLMYMMENVNNPGVLVKECLPTECHDLVNELVAPFSEDSADADPSTSVIESIETDIRRRIWDEDEHPETLRGYIAGDEMTETLSSIPLDVSSNLKRVWCRSGLVLRVLLQPLEREHRRLQGAVEQAQKKAQENGGETENGDDTMDEDDDFSEDVLAGLLESFSRYGVVLAGALAKDKEALAEQLQGSGGDGKLLTSCEPFLLMTLQSKSCFSRTLLDACLAYLLQQPETIISSMGILRWALGDVARSEGHDQQQQQPEVVDRWWEFALDALRTELAKKIGESQKSDSAGMVIDRTGEDGMNVDNSTSSATLEAVECLNPLLDYIVRTSCDLLTEKAEPGNKLKPWQVDLVEGVKSCLRASHGLLYSELKKSNENEKGVSENEIKECISQSTIAGWKLAGICQEFAGGHAVNVLRQSLTAA